MGDSPDDLRDLVRDAQGHAAWLRDQGDTEVLKAVEPVKLLRPGRAGLDPHEPVRKVHVADPARVPTTIAEAAAGHPETPIGSSPNPAVRLVEIRDVLGDCQRCRLCSGRKKIVYGVGSPTAPVMFIGEGPGADEDRTGEPFVGAAGQLLTKMIGAMGLTREQVYIANCVKCRPPENRTPQADELALCMPFLHAQIEAIQPKVIVALGKTAAQALIGEHVSITKIRGVWRSFRKGPIKMMPTYHPSFLLRTPSEKRAAWADLQLVMKELGLPVKGAAST
jgi:uracil-DNA glycosylase